MDNFRVERLASHHDRTRFSCGEPSLDEYLRRRARQDADRSVATVYLLMDEPQSRVAGYYTLSTGSVRLIDLPEGVQRKLPRYTYQPAILLGRLAIDHDYQDRRLGEALLFDALRRAHNVGTQHVAAMAVVVDALHEKACGFYERYGFVRLLDYPKSQRLMLPMGTIRGMVNTSQ